MSRRRAMFGFIVWGLINLAFSTAEGFPIAFLWLPLLFAFRANGVAANVQSLCARAPDYTPSNKLPVFVDREVTAGPDNPFTVTEYISVDCAKNRAGKVCQKQLDQARKELVAFEKQQDVYKSYAAQIVEKVPTLLQEDREMKQTLQQLDSFKSALSASPARSYIFSIIDAAQVLTIFSIATYFRQFVEQPTVICNFMAREQFLAELQLGASAFLHLVDMRSDDPLLHPHVYILKANRQFFFAGLRSRAKNAAQWKKLETANATICDPWNRVSEPVTTAVYEDKARLYARFKFHTISCVDPRCFLDMFRELKKWASPQQWAIFSDRLNAYLGAGFFRYGDELKPFFDHVFPWQPPKLEAAPAEEALPGFRPDL